MIKEGNLVKHKETGEIGVVIDDSFGCCLANEIMVVYEGTNYGHGTDEILLEDLGPEKAVADLEKCGGGQGEEACIFLAVGGDGCLCLRFTHSRDRILFQPGMNAKRHPTAMFPQCQIF